jgi:hypothetical protein
MGQRYRQNYYENGDIIDPTGWVLDNSELAGEVNGSLDRDNIAQNTITQADIHTMSTVSSGRDGPFTAVQHFTSTTNYTPENENISWQGAGNDANGLFSKSITAQEDCILVVEFTVTWAWSGAALSQDADYNADTFQLRVTVDGVVLALSNYFSDEQGHAGTYLIGTTVAVAGVHDVRVEVLCARRAPTDDAITASPTNIYDVTFSTRALCVTQEKR